MISIQEEICFHLVFSKRKGVYVRDKLTREVIALPKLIRRKSILHSSISMEENIDWFFSVE